ncbi:MAG TPA: SRPBCC domain-containing protein [Mucilaginibacter sp.]|nr:SRPBCC domain-containing protein [Mucilaginibacter sp.]
MTMMNEIPRAITDGETILATADIPATPEELYRALTTKEMETWWGAPDVYTIGDWTADLRVGGPWTLNVILPDGNALPASGEFLELAPPNKFVLTRRYDWDAPILGRKVTTVAYLLDAIEGGTRVTIRHDGFKGCAPAAYEHAYGWERLLAWLKAYFTE